MKYRFFGKHIEPSCSYCERGTAAKDGKMVLCKQKGIVYKDFHCKKFIYDPLLRIPRKKPKLKELPKENFLV